MDKLPRGESRPRDPGALRARRRLALLVGGAVLSVLLLLGFSSTTRTAVRATLLFPSFFAQLPASPLDRLQAKPLQDVVDLPPVDGYVRLHIYRPAGGRHGALVISLGMNPAPPDDPRVVRLLQGLARAGLVAVLVESESLNHDQLAPDLPNALVEAVQYTAGLQWVRPDRVGLFGFSVGGSLAIDAAAQPAISDRLRLVEAFGSFSDLEDALLSVATHTLDDDGRVRAWQPDIAAQQHLANSLISGLQNPAEQQALRAVFVDETPGATVDPGTLSPEAQATYSLLTTRDRAAGRALIGSLPAAVQADIDALSPLQVVGALHAPLFVMYDVDDPLLPFTGSRAICRAAAAAGVAHYCSPFAIFKHVDPTRLQNPLAVSHDLVELYLHALAVLDRLQ